MVAPWTERLKKVKDAFADGKIDKAQSQLASYFNTVTKLSKLGGRPPHLDIGWVDASKFLGRVFLEKKIPASTVKALEMMLVAEELRCELKPSDWIDPVLGLEQLSKAVQKSGGDPASTIGRVLYIVDRIEAVYVSEDIPDVLKVWMDARSRLDSELVERAQPFTKQTDDKPVEPAAAVLQKEWNFETWPPIVKQQYDFILPWAEKNDVEMRPKPMPSLLERLFKGDKGI